MIHVQISLTYPGGPGEQPLGDLYIEGDGTLSRYADYAVYRRDPQRYPDSRVGVVRGFDSDRGRRDLMVEALKLLEDQDV